VVDLTYSNLKAEVQTVFADGVLSLHTRSLKYGKVTYVFFTNFYERETFSFCCKFVSMRAIVIMCECVSFGMWHCLC